MSDHGKDWPVALPANGADGVSKLDWTAHSRDYDDWNEQSSDVVDQSSGNDSTQASNTGSSAIVVSNCSVQPADRDWSAHSTDVRDLVTDRNARSIEVVDFSARIIPTQETYAQLQKAYDYLNWYLFENALPNCLITLQRRGRTYGYFSPDRFGRKDGLRTDEIALNPQYFPDGTREILSTLVHEMVHLWQQHRRTAGRGGYHNAEWAAKMRSLGLQASHTGEKGGKETGDHMDHYVLPDGLFARAVEELLASGFEITWADVTGTNSGSPDKGGTGSTAGGGSQNGGRGSQSGVRTKYSCPHGDQNAWAKPGAKLVCGEHWVRMEPASRSQSN
jgi:predicted SprT family Zn-dependent metalloprotease